MFARWKVRLLGQPAYRRDVACAHREDDREVWTPVVATVERVDGKPRQKVLWHPAGSIRSCCALDQDDPIARTQWWKTLRNRFDRLRANRDENPFREQILAGTGSIVDNIYSRVPLPYDFDYEVIAVWESLADSVAGIADPYEAHQERLRMSWEAVRRARGSSRSRPSEGRRAQQAERLVVPNGFKVLGLRWPCTPDEIRNARRAGVCLHHPDKGGTQEGFVAWTAACEEVMAFYQTHGPSK